MSNLITKFLQRDSIASGLVSTLAVQVGFVVVLVVGLLVADEPIVSHVRWIGGMFIPAILLVRFYAKHQRLMSTRAAIIVLFVTFVAFMYYLFHNHLINL